ncbi:MAG: DUF2442 domain-containing protein [Betaproteobacteria bacterium]|nr:DUF2442 domain-containing protein [Betaproteobacteria bacterium]
MAGELKLRIRFDDGTEQVVDFKPFLTASLHPEIRAWSGQERFSQFHIEFGELVWGDYELCFPLIDLYLNRIEHHQALEAAA